MGLGPKGQTGQTGPAGTYGVKGTKGHTGSYMPFSKVTKHALVWVKRDGTKIPIKDMDDSHVWNVYQLLKRYHAEIPKLIEERIPQIEKDYPEFLL